MFRSKFRIFLTVIAAIFLFLSLTVACAFFYGYPEHSANITVFKAIYHITPSQKAFLEFYSPRRRDVDNGKISKEVDEFLCRRIETAESGELSAIINFYALQAGGREGDLIYKVSENAQQKIVAQVISEFDSNKNLGGKMILVEQIRRGKMIYKARVRIGNFSAPEELTIEKSKEWNDENIAPKAKDDFTNWWNLNLDWSEKRKIDPLKNSEVRIVEIIEVM